MQFALKPQHKTQDETCTEVTVWDMRCSLVAGFLLSLCTL